eukprot:GHVQ01010093.1.p1 GENE.GHVQ01010093.1~~GHVQ01010093.1.p1  ORF type:complete len:180 (-),score=19.32 GHVQ01010093.1:191-730(-)
MEELKSPIMCTHYHKASLMNGQWSPTRPGLFAVGRQDGYIDFWDYSYRQNQIAYQHKVGDAALWSMSMQNQGELCAVGDTEGTVTILRLCDELYVPHPTEKNAIGQMFDRETRREKNLEQWKRQSEVGKPTHRATKSSSRPMSPMVTGEEGVGGASHAITVKDTNALREEFFKTVGINP